MAAGERSVARPLMRLVAMRGAPVLQELRLEERLLRRTGDNWCLVNDGAAPLSIVMGASGWVMKPSSCPSPVAALWSPVVDVAPVPTGESPSSSRCGASSGIGCRWYGLRRFSGGGTVVVDQGTVFVTFICNKAAVAGLQPFPRDIMSWTGRLYGQVFQGFGKFYLRENDYSFNHQKFGGNAQSITKDRWLHHTSFLWDYDANNMDYLKVPKRAPIYRMARNHTDFLCRMNEYMPSRSVFTERVMAALGDHFTVRQTELEGALSDDKEFVPSTKVLSPQDLEDIIS